MIRWRGVLAAAWTALMLADAVQAQAIHVEPREALVDVPLSIRATGLAPGQPAILRAYTEDARGRVWQSHAGFYADERGRIDFSVRAPVHSDYSGVDPMGLIRSLQLPLGQRDGGFFPYEPLQPVVTRFVLEVDGREVHAIDATRRFARSDLKIRDVRENGLVGRLFLPATPGPHPGLIVLGGSGGGFLFSEEEAALLASRGYAALALAYFSPYYLDPIEGLPQALEEIPLEYFKKAIDWMQSQPFLAQGQLGLFGTSKGAEVGLLLGSRHPEIRAVVAYAPSSVVWSGIDWSENPKGEEKSSWSLRGVPVPFVPYDRDPTYRPPENFPIRVVINYRYSLKNREEVKQTIIPVERINGAVLLISGKDDQLWPSSEMAEMIIARLNKYNFPFEYLHLSYDGAGHLIRKAYLPMAGTTGAGRLYLLGGTPEANAHAQEDSWPRVLEFLQRAFPHR